MAAVKRKRQNWSLDEEETFTELLEEKEVEKLIIKKKYGLGSIFSMIADEMKKRGYDRNVLQITEKYKKMKKLTRKDSPLTKPGRSSNVTWNSTNTPRIKIETATSMNSPNGFATNMIGSHDSENAAACQAIETTLIDNDFNYGVYGMIPENHIIETIGSTAPEENVLIEGIVQENNIGVTEFKNGVIMNDADKMAERFLENLTDSTNEIISQIAEDVPHPTDGMLDDGSGNILLFLPEKVDEDGSDIVQNSLQQTIGSFVPFSEDDMIVEDPCPTDFEESDSKDHVNIDPSLNKAKTNYSRALTGFLDKWITTCDNLWESQKAFWDEQKEAMKKWEENVLEIQRKNNMELVMMCNNTLKSAILKLCSDRKFVLPTDASSSDHT